MKIEIGESLALSYLKHVKRCVLYQTNWKSSSKWDKSNNVEVKSFFHKASVLMPFEDVFKNSDLDQLIKQAEIDVLGMDREGKIYAVDIAFHEAGLNYKDTPERVAKKMLRSYLALLIYFPNREYEIIFASPKVGKTLHNAMEKAFEELKTICADHPKVKFIYLANEEFRKEILEQTITASEEDADGAELFVRSYKLWRLFDSKEAPASGSSKDTKRNLSSLEIELIPSDKELFKEQLLITKKAQRTYFYDDGRLEEDQWNADHFSEGSNLRGNILSASKARNREKTGLVKIKLEIV